MQGGSCKSERERGLERKRNIRNGPQSLCPVPSHSNNYLLASCSPAYRSLAHAPPLSSSLLPELFELQIIFKYKWINRRQNHLKVKLNSSQTKKLFAAAGQIPVKQKNDLWPSNKFASNKKNYLWTIQIKLTSGLFLFEIKITLGHFYLLTNKDKVSFIWYVI